MIAAQKSPMRRQLSAQSRSSQSGVTLIVGLIMLLLISLIVAGAFSISSSNLKSVGNMQVREEGIAAANLAIEQVMSSPFTDAPAYQEINVDINKDGTNDYLVKVETPTCTKALIATSAAATEVGFGPSVSDTWNTEWDINASVTDTASGASVRIRQGIRVRLLDAQKKLVCP